MEKNFEEPNFEKTEFEAVAYLKKGSGKSNKSNKSNKAYKIPLNGSCGPLI